MKRVVHIFWLLSGLLTQSSALLAASLSEVAPWELQPAQCQRRVTPSLVASQLKPMRDRVIGFEHLAVLQELESLAAELPCLDQILPPPVLSDFWFTLGLARLYKLDEQGLLATDARAVAREAFEHSLRIQPDRSWNPAELGEFGLSVWTEAQQARASATTLAFLAPVSGLDLHLNGSRLRSEASRVSVELGAQLLQWTEAGKIRTRWFWVRSGDGQNHLRQQLGAAGERVLPPVKVVTGAPDPERHSPSQPPEVRESGSPGVRVLNSEGGGGELKVGAGMALWSLPLVYAGPAASLRLKLELPVEVELGLGLGFNPTLPPEPGAPAVIYVLLPVEGSVRWVLREGRTRVAAGLGWTGYVGPGFHVVGSEFPPQALLHGVGVSVRAGGPVGPLSWNLRLSGGGASWPGGYILPQLSVLAGLEGRIF